MESSIFLADHAATPSHGLYGGAPCGLAQSFVFQSKFPQTFYRSINMVYAVEMSYIPIPNGLNTCARGVSAVHGALDMTNPFRPVNDN